MGIGVSLAGFHPVEVVERESYCCDTLRKNRERGIEPVASWPLMQCDVQEVDFLKYEQKVECLREAHLASRSQLEANIALIVIGGTCFQRLSGH